MREHGGGIAMASANNFRISIGAGASTGKKRKQS
jgi:hypothetical protein